MNITTENIHQVKKMMAWLNIKYRTGWYFTILFENSQYINSEQIISISDLVKPGRDIRQVVFRKEKTEEYDLLNVMDIKGISFEKSSTRTIGANDKEHGFISYISQMKEECAFCENLCEAISSLPKMQKNYAVAIGLFGFSASEIAYAWKSRKERVQKNYEVALKHLVYPMVTLGIEIPPGRELQWLNRESLKEELLKTMNQAGLNDKELNVVLMTYNVGKYDNGISYTFKAIGKQTGGISSMEAKKMLQSALMKLRSNAILFWRLAE